MNHPTVSVLTTCYNRAAFITETIESVLAQTFEDFEYIIVDDCSTDDSYEIAKQYESRDPRVRVYRNETNLGDYPNRNQAASYATGTYLKYVDSDDVMYPHCLQVMVAAMQQFPKAGLGLSSYGDTRGAFPRELEPAEAYRANFFDVDLFGRAPGSAIILRTAFEETGGFSGTRQVGDHEFWLKLAQKFSIVRLPRDLVWDRDHEQKESNYDSLLEREKMHLEVVVRALSATECPMMRAERVQALERIRSQFRKSMFRSLIHGRLSDAWAMRRLAQFAGLNGCAFDEHSAVLTK